MHARWVHKYVIYRIDHYLGHEGRDSPADLVTIKDVVDTEAEAIAEVERLRTLRSGDGFEYRWQSAKYYPDGR